MSEILLLSCYELGHQPLSLAWPLAVLRQDGLDVAVADLAVDDFPVDAATDAKLIAIASPMLTAAHRRGRRPPRGRSTRRRTSRFFGLYAWMNAAYLLGGEEAERREGGEATADSVLAGRRKPSCWRWRGRCWPVTICPRCRG
ncbi:MAG: hypothetical protein R2873_13075 [Caldilineaceae bacterium]